MKSKTKKIWVTIISVLVVFAIGGFLGYHYYVVPKILVPMLSKASEVVNNEEFERQVREFAKELVDDGVLDPAALLDEDMQNKLNQLGGTGAEQINPNDAADSETDGTGTNTESGGTNVQQGGQNPLNAGQVETKASEKPVSTKKPAGDTAYERIKSAATPSEFAEGAAIISKIDIAHAQKLLSTDKAEFKKYVTSRLSSAEIAKAFRLYAKYSYLLK